MENDYSGRVELVLKMPIELNRSAKARRERRGGKTHVTVLSATGQCRHDRPISSYEAHATVGPEVVPNGRIASTEAEYPEEPVYGQISDEYVHPLLNMVDLLNLWVFPSTFSS